MILVAPDIERIEMLPVLGGHVSSQLKEDSHVQGWINGVYGLPGYKIGRESKFRVDSVVGRM